MGRAAAVPLGGGGPPPPRSRLSPPGAGAPRRPAPAPSRGGGPGHPPGHLPRRAPPAPPVSPPPGATRGWVRVNQQGYLPGEPQQAGLMTPAPVSGTRYQVTDSSGTVVQRGRVPARSAGSWGRRIRAVYRLDLGALHRPGRYR